MSHYSSEAQINRSLNAIRCIYNSTDDCNLREMITSVLEYAENKNNPTEYRYNRCKKLAKVLKNITNMSKKDTGALV